MKFNFIDKYLIIEDYTVKEKERIIKLLTWVDSSFLEQDRNNLKRLKQLSELTEKEASFLAFLEHKYKNSLSCLVKEKDNKLSTFHYLSNKLKDKFDNIEFLNSTEIPLGDKVQVDKGVLDGIVLYDFQKEAVEKCIYRKFGNVVIPTAGGKTFCILALLETLDKIEKLNKALIIVPTVAIGEQFIEVALSVGFNKNDIKKLSGGFKDFDAKVLVAVVNTVAEGIKNKDENIIKLLDDVNVMIMDECHHMQAESWYSICRYKDYDYLLGFSGSLFHNIVDILKSYHDAFLYGYFGDPIFKVSSQYLRSIGLISQPFVYMENMPGMSLKYKGRFNNIYDKFIVNDQNRNNVIIEYANKFLELGLSTIIMVQRKNHGIELLKKLNRGDCICIYGGSSGYVLDNNEVVPVGVNYDVFRQDFNNDVYRIAIFSQVGDEGMNLPNANALIFGGAGKSRIKVLQRLGRILRKKDRVLNHSYVLDFIDNSHVYLKAQSYSRLKVYKEEGSIICSDKYQFINMIYKDFKRGE